MSDRNDERDSQDGDDLCIVCFKNVEYYSVGLCDHPVCYECSTRMRVLCNQNECPICRAQMPKVIFTNTVEPFNALMPRFERTPFQDRKYGLIFTSPEIHKAYKKLLEFRCNICCQDPSGGKQQQQKFVFHSFPQLKDHMRREHALSYCSLCVDNLKIFCFERKCYTQQELGVHRRKGDADDTSHRGHPLCEFCDMRFMDSDELFRHLRRNHLFCHLCDADGKHQYYPTMADLTRHYQEEHYLCEEGDCKNMPLTAAFRTEIDLKAHIAIEHGRHLSKSANKQARTLELEFTLAPRPRPERSHRLPPPQQQHLPSARTYQEEGAVGYDIEPGGPGGGGGGGGAGPGGVNTPSLNPQNFPALGGSNSVMVPSGNFTSKANPFGISGSQRNLTKNAENFPCLGAPSSSASGGPGTDRLSVNNTGQRSIQVNQFGNGGYTTTTTFSSTRPASSSTVIKKPTASSTSTLSSSSNGFNQQKPAGEAFPALGKASSSSVQPKWVQQKPKKQQESKLAKVAPAPRLPPTDLSQFPVLSKSSSTTNTTNTSSSSSNKQKKSSSVTVPVSGDWTEVRPSSSYVEKSKTADNGGGNNKSKKQKNKKNNSNNTTSNNNTNNNQTNTNNNNGSGSYSINNNNNGVLSNKAEQPHQNGMIKKRSELKIGQLSSTQATASGGDGTKPPPGFPSKPPPGLGGSNFPGLGGSNDLTFTNSRGQSYSITPAQVGFHQPSNFASRNQKLFQRLAEVADNDALREFKSYSALFREGRLPTKNYYEHCKSILKSKFDDVFPELLVLLPDIEKQQGLYSLYQGASKSHLLACENCKQVIYKRELSEHYSYHTLESQFPSLGTKTSSDSTNAWRK